MSDVPVEQLRAMIRLLGPEEMTPIAKRQLQQLCVHYEEDLDDDRQMTPPIAFSREENAALLAAVSGAVVSLEHAHEVSGLPKDRLWSLLNSLRTLFAENGYAFERQRD